MEIETKKSFRRPTFHKIEKALPFGNASLITFLFLNIEKPPSNAGRPSIER